MEGDGHPGWGDDTCDSLVDTREQEQKRQKNKQAESSIKLPMFSAGKMSAWKVDGVP